PAPPRRSLARGAGDGVPERRRRGRRDRQLLLPCDERRWARRSRPPRRRPVPGPPTDPVGGRALAALPDGAGVALQSARRPAGRDGRLPAGGHLLLAERLVYPALPAGGPERAGRQPLGRPPALRRADGEHADGV